MTRRKDDPVDQLALYKYALNYVWDHLCHKSGDCDSCDDIFRIKMALAKLCNELSIKIKLDKD